MCQTPGLLVMLSVCEKPESSRAGRSSTGWVGGTVSIVTASAPDSAPGTPVAETWRAEILCTPSLSGLSGAISAVPLPSAEAEPITSPDSSSCVSRCGDPCTANVGDATLVMLSVFELQWSLESTRSGTEGLRRTPRTYELKCGRVAVTVCA